MFYEMIKWVQTMGGIYPDPGPHTYAGPVCSLVHYGQNLK